MIDFSRCNSLSDAFSCFHLLLTGLLNLLHQLLALWSCIIKYQKVSILRLTFSHYSTTESKTTKVFILRSGFNNDQESIDSHHRLWRFRRILVVQQSSSTTATLDVRRQQRPYLQERPNAMQSVESTIVEHTTGKGSRSTVEETVHQL